MAGRWSCGRGSFLEVLKAIAGFDTSRRHTLQKRPLDANLRSTYSTSRPLKVRYLI